MNDKDKLVRHLANGYTVLHVTSKISTLNKNGEGFLEDPLNQDKSIIIFNKGCIITDDAETLEFARQILEKGNEIIGTRIVAVCEMLGTDKPEEDIGDIDIFINSLNENSTWEFKLSDNSIFLITISTDSSDRILINQNIEKIRKFVDLLSHSQSVGILIRSIQESHIRKRKDPVFTEIKHCKNLQPLSKELTSNIFHLVDCHDEDKLFEAAHGLNQSFIENCLPNRLSMLWATVESLFRTKQNHLLTSDEIDQLINAADQIETLKSESEKWRLDILRKGIRNSELFSSKTRNQRIALSISKELGLDYEDTLKNIRTISKKRGKHLHQLIGDSGEIRESEVYLQKILHTYINKQIIDKQIKLPDNLNNE